MTQNNERFNIKVVRDKFEAALQNEDDVRLEEYLDSFEELNKFFTLIGSVFGFVSKDLKAKIGLLKELLKNSNENFASVKEMIEYEKNNELLNKKGYTSGARTLLRIHRGLEFIKLFLKKLGELKDDDNTSMACREAYDQTLANHHPFIIRNGAKVAIYTLPSRGVLLNRVCGEPECVQEALDSLPKTLEASCSVYERIDNIYKLHDLHQLP